MIAKIHFEKTHDLKKWQARLVSLDGHEFVFSDNYVHKDRDKAVDLVVQEAKRIAERWNSRKTIEVNV